MAPFGTGLRHGVALSVSGQLTEGVVRVSVPCATPLPSSACGVGYHEGVDVQARLPNLSVYMGHVRPQESYWYLSATPELLTAAAERFRFYATEGGIS